MRTFAIRASRLPVRIFGVLDLIPTVLLPLLCLNVGRTASSKVAIDMEFSAFEGQLFIV